MTQVTIFEAADGSRFDSKKLCEEYEALCARVDAALSPLPMIDDIQDGQFYQHDPNLVRSVADAFVVVARSAVWKDKEGYIHPHSILQRIISDSNKKCLNRASNWINRIDLETGREYSQPYFRFHPTEATTEVHR